MPNLFLFSMKAGLQPGSTKPGEGFETPPPFRKQLNVFQSPTSSVSTESGIDVAFHSFRTNGRVNKGRRKNILPVSEDEEAAPDSVFMSPTPNNKPDLK